MARVDTEHEDPAIGAFLGLLEADICAGRHIHSLPEDLAKAMLAQANQPVNVEAEIEGEVEL